jgi:hypothetical protein
MTFSALKTRQKVPTRHSTAIYIVWRTSQFMITGLTTSNFRTHLKSNSIFLNPISIYATKLSPLKILHATCLDSCTCMFPVPNFRCIVLSALMCHFYTRSERVQIHRRVGHRICGSTHCAFITPKIKFIFIGYYMLTKSQRSTEVNSTWFICPCTRVRSVDCRSIAMSHYDAFLSVRLRSLYVAVRPLCDGAETVLLRLRLKFGP